MMKEYCIYILTNKTNQVLYTGITSDLDRRLAEHRSGAIKGFSSQYRTFKLVYIEMFPDVEEAIQREKQLKNWRREKKDWLINQQNPEWLDITSSEYQNKLDVSPLSSRAKRSGVEGSGQNQSKPDSSTQLFSDDKSFSRNDTKEDGE